MRRCPSGTAGSRRRAPKAALPLSRSKETRSKETRSKATRSNDFPPWRGSALAIRVSSLEGEQQQERDQQREDAERLGDGKAEDQVGELALSGGRIAQRGGEIVAEDGADADAGAAHADTRNAGADILGGHWIHDEAPFWCGW